MARRVRKSRAENIRWNQMIEALRLMNFAMNNIRLYPPNHSEVVGGLKKLLEIMSPIIEEQEDIGFGFMDEVLYIEGSMSIEETANNQMLVDRFTRCRVKYLTFMKGVGMEDISTLFQILNAEAIKPTDVCPGEQLTQKGIQTIHIVEAEVDDIASKAKAGRKKTLFDWYLKAIDVLGKTVDALKQGADADTKPLYRLADDLTATMRNKGYEPYLLLPFMTKGLDPHLAHNVNVALLCCAMGDLQRLNTGQLNSVVFSAFLHDLGRATIPVEWTQDHSPLSPEERRIAAQHADWGFLLLSRHEDIAVQTGLAAAYHHQASFPEGQGYRADVAHRLIEIADTYEMGKFTDRYYWRKHRPDRILRAITNKRGGRFEAPLVKLLSVCVGCYPVGSMVKLDDGRRGIVVRPNTFHPGRPKVFMIDEEGPLPDPVPGAEDEPREPLPVIVDTAELEESGLRFKRSIASRLHTPADVDIGALVDRKKEYLLSYTL